MEKTKYVVGTFNTVYEFIQPDGKRGPLNTAYIYDNFMDAMDAVTALRKYKPESYKVYPVKVEEDNNELYRF